MGISLIFSLFSPELVSLGFLYQLQFQKGNVENIEVIMIQRNREAKLRMIIIDSQYLDNF